MAQLQIKIDIFIKNSNIFKFYSKKKFKINFTLYYIKDSF
jgi:hypothetical protein